jgi:serine/threonine protein kinase
VTLASGSRLGPYEIVSPLGAGGMGEVYRAKDPRLGRDVAVKVLPASFSTDADRLRRFEQEARAAGLLNHPNITAVYDIGTHDGAPYVVSELLEGETLRNRLSAGPLPTRKALDYAIQIARGLAAAHEKGIVHRDLKPENLFVTNDGRVKILDFGLAKLRQLEAGGEPGTNLLTAATEPGVVMGTMGYMSPEQVRGRAADARSDIFSFGTILHEMLSGRRAFQGETTADTITVILTKEPPDLSLTNQDVHPGLDRIIRHSLEKNPEERFQSASDLAFALGYLGEDSTESVPPTPTPAPSAARSSVVRTRTSATVSDSSRASIAVLPFRNMSADKENEYFTDGITEEIINALTKIESLRVASRTSAFAFKGRNEDIRRIGEQLGVRTVLEGSVRRAGSRLRITAELVNVGDGYHLWSERYDREMEDIFAIQDEIALAIANTLKVRLLAADEGALVSRGTEDFEAYNHFLKGKYFFNRRVPREAIVEFEQAIARDP